MLNSKFAVASVSILVGVVVGIILTILVKGTPQVPPPPNNPNDSPVTVRGGSVEALTSYTWSQPDREGHPAFWQTTGTDTTQVFIEGNKGGTTPGVFSQTGISANWKITLIFRDENDGPDYSGDELLLCSNEKNYSCDPSEALSSGSNSLYVIADGAKPGSFVADLTGAAKSAIDGYSLLRYDVPSCGAGNPRDTRCNHLYQVEVSNITGLNGYYTCQAGGCEIGIGPSTIIAAKH